MRVLNTYGVSCLVSGLFLFFICVEITFLRFWSQRIRRKPFRHHDYLVPFSLTLIALGLAFKVTCKCALVTVKDVCLFQKLIHTHKQAFAFGEGDHIWNVSSSKGKPLLVYFTISSILWNAALASTRVSMLLFYVDIFKSKRFRHVSYLAIALSLVCFFANLVLQLLSCSPLWTIWSPVEMTTCEDMLLIALITTSADGAALDFITTVLPITVLWNMQLALRRKIGIMLTFGTMLL